MIGLVSGISLSATRDVLGTFFKRLTDINWNGVPVRHARPNNPEVAVYTTQFITEKRAAVSFLKRCIARPYIFIQVAQAFDAKFRASWLTRREETEMGEEAERLGHHPVAEYLKSRRAQPPAGFVGSSSSWGVVASGFPSYSRSYPPLSPPSSSSSWQLLEDDPS